MLVAESPRRCLNRSRSVQSFKPFVNVSSSPSKRHRISRPAPQLPHAALNTSACSNVVQTEVPKTRASNSCHVPFALHQFLPAWNSLINIARKLIEASRRHGSSFSYQGVAAVMAVCLPPGFTERGMEELLTNRCFWVGFWGWFTAQTLKIFTHRYKKGVWDLQALVASGGMPSSHSALCAAVTTDIALQYGLGSPMFALGLCFSAIVMYDAAGVRRHAGKQAEVLNQVITDMLSADHPVRVNEVKLKEVLGHTPRQVVVGALLGILMGVFHPMPIVRLTA